MRHTSLVDLTDYWDNREKFAALDAPEKATDQAASVSAVSAPAPGERCPTCDRRVNKPRKSSSPTTRRVSGGNLPPERAEALNEALDALQAYCGADGKSYPRGTLLEALVLLGGQEREALKEFFVGA